MMQLLDFSKISLLSNSGRLLSHLVGGCLLDCAPNAARAGWSIHKLCVRCGVVWCGVVWQVNVYQTQGSDLVPRLDAEQVRGISG